MIRKFAVIGIVAALAAPALAQDGERIDLVCYGGGTANKATSATAYGWDNNGNYAQGTVVGQKSVGFEEQVSLWVDGDEGRVRMPRSMLPLIRGGEDGWFKLRSIERSDGEIRGTVGVSALNNPKLRLDRYTGAISISGKSGDFGGQCQKFDPSRTQRKF